MDTAMGQMLLEEIRAARNEIKGIRDEFRDYREGHSLKHDALIVELTKLQEAARTNEDFRKSHPAEHDQMWRKIRALDKKTTVWGAVGSALLTIIGAAWAVYTYVHK